MKTKEPKFKVGDWVNIVGGPDKGTSTTLTAVYPSNKGFYYEGFYCGQMVGGTDSEVEAYG